MGGIKALAAQTPIERGTVLPPIYLKNNDKTLVRDDLPCAAPDRAVICLDRAIFRGMKRTFAAVLVVLMTGTALLSSQTNFENQYVRMTVLPGWTVDASSSPPLVKVTHGRYVLTIDPIFVHASGVKGGRISEIVSGMPSVEAVRAGVEGPWGTDCAQPNNVVIITGTLSLANLYTDDTKSNVENGCVFPSDGQPAWFGSLFVGEGSESEYTITLAYDTRDVNALPKEGTTELKQVLSDVQTMLKSLEMKPPIVISSIGPRTALPGATVTLRGSGFDLKNFNLRPEFSTFRDLSITTIAVAGDGKSMIVEIPASRTIRSCDRPGYAYIGENCVAASPNSTYIECPRVNDRHPTFCGVPFPAGVYSVQVVGIMVRSNELSLTVTAPQPTPVFISLLYPDSGVIPGDTIRVQGKGFTRTSNTVKIGSAAVVDEVIDDVPSSDGTTLSFAAPDPPNGNLTPVVQYYDVRISNANGESNQIIFRYAGQY